MSSSLPSPSHHWCPFLFTIPCFVAHSRYLLSTFIRDIKTLQQIYSILGANWRQGNLWGTVALSRVRQSSCLRLVTHTDLELTLMSEPTLLSQPTVIGGSLELKESDGTSVSTADKLYWGSLCINPTLWNWLMKHVLHYSPVLESWAVIKPRFKLCYKRWHSGSTHVM